MALTTRDSVKTLAGWSTTTYDARIDALLSRVTTYINKWLGYTVEQTTGIVEFPEANSNDLIRLRAPPVTFTGLTSIYYDPAARFGRGANDFAATTLLTEGTDYVLRVDQPDGVTSLCGLVQRINGVWPGRYSRSAGRLSRALEPHRGHIKVTYDGGWATVPGDIALAANLLIIRTIMMGPKGQALISESYAGYSWSAMSPPTGNSLMTNEIIGLLLPYQRLTS